MERLAARAIKTFGAVHLLFNNAGVGGGVGFAWEPSLKDIVARRNPAGPYASNPEVAVKPR